jgi:hypothetical protein
VAVEEDRAIGGDPMPPAMKTWSTSGDSTTESPDGPSASTMVPSGNSQRARLKPLPRSGANRVVSITRCSNGAETIVKYRVVLRSSDANGEGCTGETARLAR